MLNLLLTTTTYAICRLDSSTPIPEWALNGDLISITRTTDELSIVCPQANIPENIRAEHNWRCFKVAGPLDFALTGIMASLTVPLAQAGISVFAISTFDTDYLLVKEDKVTAAVKTLEQVGFTLI